MHIVSEVIIYDMVVSKVETKICVFSCVEKPLKATDNKTWLLLTEQLTQTIRFIMHPL